MTAEQRLACSIYAGWQSGKYQRKEVKQNGTNTPLFGTGGQYGSRRIPAVFAVPGGPLPESGARADAEDAVGASYHFAAALYRGRRFFAWRFPPARLPVS